MEASGERRFGRRIGREDFPVFTGDGATVNWKKPLRRDDAGGA